MEALMILGRAVPVYGLIGVSGICLAMAYALFSCRKFGLDRDDTAYIFVFGALGAAAGAKILYLLVSTGDIISDIQSDEMSLELVVNKYISGGMVFYGGLIGALLLAGYAAGRYGKEITDFFPVLIPGFALAHGIARIGCLLVGCCYGIEADIPFSITYHSSHIAPNDVPLLPVPGDRSSSRDIDICCPRILCRAYNEQGQYTVDIYTSVCTGKILSGIPQRRRGARRIADVFGIAVDKYHTGCSRTGAYIYFGQAKQETGFQEAGK